jgi:hypothetical protein
LTGKFSKITKIAVGIFVVGILFLSGESPEIAAQFANLKNFLDFSDPILSVGLFLEWAKKVFWLAILFLIFAIFSRKKNFFEKNSGKIFAAGVFGGILFFGIFFADFQKIISEKWKSENPTAKWIDQNLDKNALFFASGNAESFCVFLRNHFGKNCFVSHVEGGQTAFSRSAAIEWRDRRKFQKNPEKYFSELKNRGVNFLIFKKDETFDGEIIFENSDFKIFQMAEK